jgi:hypothetical protein
MKDPERWLEDPSAAPQGAVELLRAAARPTRPPPDVRARLGSKLAEMVAGGARPRPPLWHVGAGVLVAAVGVGAWLGIARLRAAPPAPPAPVPVASAPASPPPVAPPVAPPPAPEAAAPALAPPAPAPAETGRPAPAPRHAPSRIAEARRNLARTAAAPAPGPAEAAPVGDSLAREAALVEEARRTVRDRPAAALAALERHRREFPSGQLTAEREFLAVRALLELGRRAEAEQRGHRLVEAYPGSAYAQQVPALLR